MNCTESFYKLICRCDSYSVVLHKKTLATKLSQQPLHILEEIYQASEVDIDLNVLKT